MKRHGINIILNVIFLLSATGCTAMPDEATSTAEKRYSGILSLFFPHSAAFEASTGKFFDLRLESVPVQQEYSAIVRQFRRQDVVHCISMDFYGRLSGAKDEMGTPVLLVQRSIKMEEVDCQPKID